MEIMNSKAQVSPSIHVSGDAYFLRLLQWFGILWHGRVADGYSPLMGIFADELQNFICCVVA